MSSTKSNGARRRGALIVATVAVALCSFGSSVASASTAPLELEFDYHGSILPPSANCADALFSFSTEGTGGGTVLGGNAKLSAPDRCAYAVPGSTDHFKARGPVTYEAANGDKIYAQSELDSVMGTDSVVNDGTITITGGTGRFAGASGVGHWHCEASLVTLVGHGSLVGVINRP